MQPARQLFFCSTSAFLACQFSPATFGSLHVPPPSRYHSYAPFSPQRVVRLCSDFAGLPYAVVLNCMAAPLRQRSVCKSRAEFSLASQLSPDSSSVACSWLLSSCGSSSWLPDKFRMCVREHRASETLQFITQTALLLLDRLR